MPQKANDLIGQTIGSWPVIRDNLLYTIIVIVVLWALRMLVVRFIMGRTEDIRLRYVWHKSVNYFTLIVGVFLVAKRWFFSNITSLETFLGLVSAGIAISLRDPITNIAGWFFVMWTRPLDVGDRIQIGEYAGDVVDISIFHLTIMEIGNWVDADQSTGRVIKIPNSLVFSQPLANFSKGFEYIWNEVPVLVTFESNWRKAKEILTDIARRQSEDLSDTAERKVIEASKRFLIYYKKLTPIVYTSVKDSGVLLTVRYLCEPRKRRGTAEVIWEQILDAFALHDDIDFAYPTTRYYDNPVEGKSGTKPVAGAAGAQEHPQREAFPDEGPDGRDG